MEFYQILPVFTGPNMFPEERMAHYRDNIRPYLQYCGLSIIPKLTAWCQYIKEYDLKMQSLKKNSSYINKNPNVTIQSIIKSLNDAACYDSYYCNVPSLAGTIHALMVAMALISVIGFVFNMFCLIKMYIKGNRNFVRNSFGIYISAVIVVDCLKLVLILLIYIIPALRSNQYRKQLDMYQSYTFLVVPVLLPLLDLTCALVPWFVVALLVQRSNITRTKLIAEADGFGFVNVSAGRDRRRTYWFVVIIIVVLFLFVVPKFAEYTFNYDMTTGKGIVIPLLRIFKIYRIVYLKFLSPSVECVVPIIVMLAHIAVIKYNEVLLTRYRHIRRQKTVVPSTDNVQLIGYNAQVLSVTGISRKTQLVIWISVLVLTDLIMKLSNTFVELERNLGSSPKEEWPRLRQIIKYMSVSMTVIIVMAKPVIYVRCCPRFLKKSFSKHFIIET